MGGTAITDNSTITWGLSRVILDYTCLRAKSPLLKFRRRSGLLAENSETDSALVNKTNVQGINSITSGLC